MAAFGSVLVLSVWFDLRHLTLIVSLCGQEPRLCMFVPARRGKAIGVSLRSLTCGQARLHKSAAPESA